ncbi:MAG: hypothetical protein H7837_04765 [Magnetococcus sp. MYC-9]
MPEHNPARLVSLFHAASRQKREWMPHLLDRRFVADGGKLLYAVDTDTVKLYTNTQNMALPSDHREEGYSQIFPGDDDTVSVALGWALARFIFFHRLNGDGSPLIVLPPLEQEVRRVFAAVVRHADNKLKQADAEIARLRAFVKELQSESSPEARLERFVQKAPTLFEVLQGQEEHAVELRRFGELLSHACIAPLALVQSHEGWVQDPVMRSALRIEQDDLESFLRFRALREAWYHRLKGSKSSRTSTLNLIDDATALAYLEGINGQFPPGTHRLVMISGDASMQAAAQSYHPRDNKEHSFADLYLRHPRAYVHEVLLDADNHPTGLSFGKWLDLFLAEPCAPLHGQTDGEPEKVAARILEIHPDMVTKFESAWRDYTRHVVAAHVSALPKEDPTDLLRGLDQEETGLLEELGHQLRQKKWETWSAFLGVATLAGIEVLFSRQSARRQPPRNVPPLAFRRYPEARKLLWSLLEARESSPLSPADYHTLLEKTQQEDETRYAFFVAFGVLFAAGGNWHLAAVLGEHAWQTARRGESARNTGREAAYLTAVASRHVMRDPGTDLPMVEKWLVRAEECLREERREDPDKLAGETRFVCERQAAHLTAHLFHAFKGYSLDALSVPDLATLQSQIMETLDGLSINGASDVIERWLNRNVERSLLTNLFATLFLRVGHHGESLSPGDYSHYFKRFQDNITYGNTASGESAIQLSYLVQAIAETADIWIHAHRPEGKRKLEQLRENVNGYFREGNKELPYDADGFRFLLRFAEQCLP